MMKKLVSILPLLFTLAGLAQDNETLKKHYLKIYNQGIVYNDVNTAIQGLQGYLAADNNMAYKDTLSMFYFSARSYYSALLLAEEVYKAVPTNVEAMARAAESYDELGDPKTATSLYEQVVTKTKNPYHLYKLGIAQYQLKRIAESEASARAALADTSSKRIGVNFMMSDGTRQAVPVDAAATNLLGVLKMDAKNFAGAKADFTQALKLFPQFTGAKENLDAVEKQLKGTKTTGTKPKTN